MLNSIIEKALRFKGIVLIAALAMLAGGAYLSSRATLDVFPDFVPPSVTIQTEAPGLSPGEVEALVTFPIESAVGGIPGLETSRSESIQGLSVIDLMFAEGSGELADRQLLAERLAELSGTLPSQARMPTISPMVSSTLDLLKIGLVSEELSPLELRSLADWTVAPLLKAVSGVADVTVVGGEAEEFQVEPDLEKMVALGVTLNDISLAVSGAVGVRGAGYVETRNQRLVIHASGPKESVKMIGRVKIKGIASDVIELRDVADLRFGGMPKFGDALINGERGVMIAMTSQRGANTLSTTLAVEEALNQVLPALQAKGVKLVGGLHRPANFIEVALHHLIDSLLLGGALVGVILLLFLADLRTAFISFISIPLSLLSAVVVMHFAGIPLNTMTLGGLAVAVGVVVDDAIIDVENILRRLRLNRRLAAPRRTMRVILEASIEVRGAVIYATLIVIAVFLPVFALSGLPGRFFQPLAMAFILAVLSSLIVAMTVTPALCLALLGRANAGKELFYIRWMKSAHVGLLRTLFRIPRVVIVLALIAAIGAGVLWRGVEHELLPPFREGHFVAQAFGVPGTSLEETMRFGEKVSDELLEMPEIHSVEMQAGRSERGVDSWGPERCEFHIELEKSYNFDAALVQETIQGVLDGFPNMQTETLTFLGDRVGESLSGETAAVVVSIYGEDLDELDGPADKISQVMGQMEGGIEVNALGTTLAPGIKLELDAERLRQHGLRPLEVLSAVQTAFQGTEVAQIYSGNRVIPVNIRLDDEKRSDVSALASLLIGTPSGATVRLEDLGKIDLSQERASIRHEAGKRRQVVTCNVSGRGVRDFVDELRKRINAVGFLPKGVYAVFTGAAEAEATSHMELVVATGITLMIIGVFLSMVFRRTSHFLLVISILPFAVAGGVYAIVISGITLSLGALIGFITLLGLSIRNTIMLMTHYEHLMKEECCEWSLETAIRGASERMVPVLMTTVVTGLALLPLAIAPETAGREVEGPMAIVILGGLISSTIVTLLVLPVAAWRFGKWNDLSAEENEELPAV